MAPFLRHDYWQNQAASPTTKPFGSLANILLTSGTSKGSAAEGFSFCEAESPAAPAADLRPTSGPDTPTFRPAAGFSAFGGSFLRHVCFIVFFSTS